MTSGRDRPTAAPTCHKDHAGARPGQCLEARRGWRGVDASRLRDRTGNSRLAILARLHEHPGEPLSVLADLLGVSVQAASQHVQALVAEGLVVRPGRVSPAGLQRLRDGVVALQDAVASLGVPFAAVRRTSAIAGQDLRAGQEVALRMRDGLLEAMPGRGPSTGRTVAHAAAGDEILVEALEGVVDLAPGGVVAVRLPGPDAGGLAVLDPAWRAPTARVVAAAGTGAVVFARRTGVEPVRFAPVEAAIHAARLGLHAVLLVTDERWAEAEGVLRAAEVRFSITDAPRGRAKAPVRPG